MLHCHLAKPPAGVYLNNPEDFLINTGNEKSSATHAVLLQFCITLHFYVFINSVTAGLDLVMVAPFCPLGEPLKIAFQPASRTSLCQAQ